MSVAKRIVGTPEESIRSFLMGILSRVDGLRAILVADREGNRVVYCAVPEDDAAAAAKDPNAADDGARLGSHAGSSELPDGQNAPPGLASGLDSSVTAGDSPTCGPQIYQNVNAVFSVTAEQAEKLDVLGKMNYALSFYEGGMVVQVNVHPLVVTFHASLSSNAGQIVEQIPILRQALEPLRARVAAVTAVLAGVPPLAV